ncbi:hypothetical protein H5410_056511 [Solanum commersonii]|uniref:Uncharacterized protein n=1 Tax=Solanum commersonii TaxID=4109 RepID=A0A9J5WKF1_SOLCO|nr:hypothetical protein H5410_056511 [Solanum commersonii]
MMSEIRITKRSMDYSTRKSAKWVFSPHRGSFDLENGPIWPSGPTGSIAKLGGSFDLENGLVYPLGPTDSKTKVLAYVHKKIWQKRHRKFESPKESWTIAQENWQNEGFDYFGERLTLKMDQFASRDQPAP